MTRARLQTGVVALLIGLGTLASGCLATQPLPPDPLVEVARRQAASAIRAAREEATGSRAELAAARIAAAKQEAELQELRRRVAGLSQDRAELATLQQDRDRLQEDTRRMQSQLAELAHLRQTAGEAVAAQAKVRELEAALEQLAAELAQAQKKLTQHRVQTQLRAEKRRRLVVDSAAPGSGTTNDKVPPAKVSPAYVGPAPDQTVLHLAVRPGDSLWGIARRHGLTVEALKEANGLTEDRIRVGQQLLVPPAYRQKATAPLASSP